MITRISIQTAGLAFGGTGLRSYCIADTAPGTHGAKNSSSLGNWRVSWQTLGQQLPVVRGRRMKTEKTVYFFYLNIGSKGRKPLIRR